MASPPCHSYTNDASLLLPVNALTGNYYVVAGADWHSPGHDGAGNPSCTTTNNSFQEPGMAVIVATQDNTSVTVAASGPLQPGAGVGATGGTLTLNHGDVLQLATALNASGACSYGSDLSGTRVTASAPVEVIGGQDCTFFPAGTFACDHIEQINFPLETLGSDYLVTLPFNNNAAPRQFVKIVGTQAGTGLTTDPAQAGVPATITAGQVVFFETTQNFRLKSTSPVLVGQFMEGQDNFGAACAAGSQQDCGDPSMSLAVATAQFRSAYQFIAPPSYFENWVNVIAPIGASVTVDGAAVTGFSSIGSSGYAVAHHALCANGACGGVHSAASAAPFGIEVYGYGIYTSYMYPGGLNLNRQ
jgi:hypothetical protein